MWSQMWTLLVVVGSIQLVVAIALRFYIKPSQEVRLRRVAPDDALMIVTDYLDGFEETRLGFPTGFFRYQTASPDGSVSFEELRSASIGWKATATVILVPITVGVAVGVFVGGLLDGGKDGEGALGRVVGVLLGGAFGVFIALYMFPLVLGATILEVVLKFLAVSRIEATARVAEDDPLDTLVAFKFRGASALLSERNVLAGFAAPVLAPALAALASPTASRQVDAA
jgi:hypothetical protein